MFSGHAILSRSGGARASIDNQIEVGVQHCVVGPRARAFGGGRG